MTSPTPARLTERAYIETLKAQNKELREALEALLKHAEKDEYLRPFQYKAIRKAEQALKKGQ